LIDSGAGSSYASAKLIHKLHIKPLDVQTKKIDMLMCSKQARLETYEVKIETTETNFAMTTNLIKVDKPELLFLENPDYENLIHNYPHLKGVTIKDRDKKPMLPVHVVLGSGDCGINGIIKDQKQSGVVEPTESPAEGVEFYLPHKPVVRETAKTTKVRIVYDASAKETCDSLSLNDCLYAGTPK
jgi:hypothetical protein